MPVFVPTPELRTHCHWLIPAGYIMDRHVRNYVHHRTGVNPSVRKRPNWRKKMLVLSGPTDRLQIAYNLSFAMMNDRDAFGLPPLLRTAAGVAVEDDGSAVEADGSAVEAAGDATEWVETDWAEGDWVEPAAPLPDPMPMDDWNWEDFQYPRLEPPAAQWQESTGQWLQPGDASWLQPEDASWH